MRLLPILFLACTAAYASFTISPSILKMQAAKGEYNGWVEVAHNGNASFVAVELIMYNRIIDFDGNIKDTLVPCKDFVIYPSQILLSPGQSIKSQIVYRGKEKIDADRVYSLLAKEMPLPKGQEEVTEASAGISIRINYDVAVLMETGKAGTLTFVSSKSLDSGKVELIMENKGKGRFSFEDMQLYVGKEKITDYTGRRNAVMPGQKRRFIFKHPKTPKADEIRFTK